jgi:hypothetical protein
MFDSEGVEGIMIELWLATDKNRRSHLFSEEPIRGQMSFFSKSGEIYVYVGVELFGRTWDMEPLEVTLMPTAKLIRDIK